MHRILKHIFGFLFLVLFAVSCGTQQSAIKGNEAYKNHNYADALYYYSRAVEDTPGRDLDVDQRMADAYRLSGKHSESAKWYASLVSQESVQPLNYYYYAKALQSQGQQVEAIDYFKKYLDSLPRDSRSVAHNDIDIEVLQRLLTKDERYLIFPVSLNTEAHEYAPAYMGSQMIFVSNREEQLWAQREDKWRNEPYFDLYLADIDDQGDLLDVNALDPLSKPYHDGPSSYSEDLSTLFFTRSTRRKGKLATGSNKTNNLSIYSSKKDDENAEIDWTDAVALGFNSVEFSSMHPAISPDDKYLIFASDRSGGFGGMDLYITYRNLLNWSKPVNLGKEINTSGDEAFPFISEDHKLIFASNGLLGLGGMDIFIADPQNAESSNGKYGKPMNPGTPLNTISDDFGLITQDSGVIGYFASNRPGGKGADDIYRVHFIEKEQEEIIEDTIVPIDSIPEEVIVAIPIIPIVAEDEFSLFVYDKATDIGLGGAVINIFNKEGKLLNAVQTSDSGYVNIKRNAFDGDVRFIASYPEYSSYRLVQNISELPSDVKVLRMPLNTDLGKVLSINPIYFDFNKSFIRPDASVELDKIIKIMKENPSMVIEVASHTDSRGTIAYNKELSKKRAESSMEYIISKGIDRSRISGRGYGENQLTNQCEDGVDCSDDDHQLNRRTEFRIVKF